MLKKIIISILLVFVFVSCKTGSDEHTAGDELLQRLQELPGVEVMEIDSRFGFPRAFQIDLSQPVDHNNPSGQTFKQRIYLSHADESLPMIMQTAGYTTSENRISELAEIISANHMTITHRYFIPSQPNPLDWQFLTIKQAADDHHRIVEIFKTIYNRKWINTGASKGGMTALFHRRFHPDDVDVTVAYVAPIITGLPDSRLNDYLENNAGDSVCREKIKRFQRMVLEHRDELLPMISDYAMTNELNFSIGLDAVLEFSALEYWFYFFQYGNADCGSIPGENATLQELFSHLDAKSPLRFYSDREVQRFRPFYYQAFTQLGYYSFIDDHLSDLLVAIPEADHRMLAPEGVEMTYDPSVMQDIISWLSVNGNNIIYIYGGQDPYTAAGVQLSGTTNAIKVVEPGADHGVRIQELTERQRVYQTLENWLDVPVGQITGVRGTSRNHRHIPRRMQSPNI